MTARLFLICGAVAGLLAVGLGAFGAHALAARLDARGSALWHTAERYQFVHALALLAVALLWGRLPQGALTVSGLLFVAGVVLFCGSLYALALGAPRRIGWITPIGGMALIAGWGALVVAALQSA